MLSLTSVEACEMVVEVVATPLVIVAVVRPEVAVDFVLLVTVTVLVT